MAYDAAACTCGGRLCERPDSDRLPLPPLPIHVCTCVDTCTAGDDSTLRLHVRPFHAGHEPALIHLYACGQRLHGCVSPVMTAVHATWTDHVVETDLSTLARRATPAHGHDRFWVATLRTGDLNRIPALRLCDCDRATLLALGGEDVVVACIACSPATVDSGVGVNVGVDLELKRLCVHSALHGAGVAPAMCAIVERHAREAGFGGVFLTTLRSMTAPMRMYTRLGYTVVSAPEGEPLPHAGVTVHVMSLRKAVRELSEGRTR